MEVDDKRERMALISLMMKDIMGTFVIAKSESSIGSLSFLKFIRATLWALTGASFGDVRLMSLVTNNVHAISVAAL